MSEREEFTYDKARLTASGAFQIGLGLAVLGCLFILPQAVPPIIAVFVVIGGALVVMGLRELGKRGQTGVQVALDAEGITATRHGADPIPWTEVERCELGRAPRGRSWVRLRLRPGSQAAARLGTVKVNIYDHALAGGELGLRRTIARLAPQVPRDW